MPLYGVDSATNDVDPANGSQPAGAAEPFAGGTTVEVRRTDAESPNGTQLGSFPVAADGTFSSTDRPRVIGQTTYTTRYAGDVLHTAATAEAVVTVTK